MLNLIQFLLERRAATSIVSIAQTLGWPESQVQKELDRLQAAGCIFEHHPFGDIQLKETGLGSWKDYLQAYVGQLPGIEPGGTQRQRMIQVYQSTDSTQNIARTLMEDHADKADGALVVADHQTRGRGRLGRLWTAPPGTCVLFSMVHLAQPGKASDGPQSVNWLSAVMAVAVAIAIETTVRYYQEPRGKTLDEYLESESHDEQTWVRIKWPNDLIVGSGKLCGILVESIQARSGLRGAIIGVGLNVSLDTQDLAGQDKDIADRATSLKMQGRPIDRLPLLTAIVRLTDRFLRNMGSADLIAHWRKRSTLLGQMTHLRCDGRDIHGQVIDLDPHVGLIVRTTGGQVVHLRAETTTVIQ